MNNRGKIISVSFFGILVLFGILLIFSMPEGKSNPDTGVTNCTALTTAGETYNLTNDILNNQITDNCINISASNIILNCQGHYIFSIQNYSGVYSNSTNTTIKNCNITMGSGGNANAKGIYLKGVSSGNSTLFNNSIFGDSSAGIYLYSSSNNNLTSNIGISNSGDGFYLYYNSNNNLLTSNTGINNYLGYGFDLYLSNNNTFTSNIGLSNSSYAINSDTSSNNTFISNNLLANYSTVISFYSSPSNFFELNKFPQNYPQKYYY